VAGWLCTSARVERARDFYAGLLERAAPIATVHDSLVLYSQSSIRDLAG